MAQHLVVIFGPSRSGKDTFINHLYDEFENRNKSIRILSSIDIVKNFFTLIKDELNLPDTGEVLSASDRQALADTKAVLDRQFNWTVDYAMTILGKSRADVLIYQVREVDNINKLRAKCKLHEIDFTGIFIYRPGVIQEGAKTDIYDANTILLSDVDIIIPNKELVNLPTWAAIVARLILKETS